MNLLDLFVKVSVDDQASGKMDGISAGMIAKGQLIADGIKSAMSAAANAVQQVIGGAVDVYKEYEQLAGGIETFFGDAADTVIQNAQNAYQTAGMSANQYMSTVSMFATTLVRSVAEGNAKTTEDSGQAAVDALQGQYEALSDTLSSELSAMQQGFQDANRELSRALADELDEFRKAQQQELKDRQEQLEQQYEARQEEISQEVEARSAQLAQEYEILQSQLDKEYKLRQEQLDREYKLRQKQFEKQYSARQKELQDEIKSITEMGKKSVASRKASLEQEYDALSKSLDSQVSAYRKATDAHIKEIDREYRESLKNIDREEYERLKAIDEQIAAIEGLTKAEEREAKAQEQATKKAELEKVLASAKTERGRAKAREQLNAYLAQIEAEQTKELRKEQIERLKDEKDAVKEQASERKDTLKSAYDEEKAQYKEQRADGLNEMREANKQELAERKAHNEAIIAQEREDNARVIEQRRANMQLELAAMKESNSEQLSVMKQNNSEQLSAIKENNSKILKARKASNDSQLAEFRKSKQDELKEFRKSQNEELEQLRESQSDELKQRQRANEDIMTEQQRAQQAQLEEARNANKAQLDELKKRIEEQKALVKSGADSMGEFVTASAKDQEEAARLAQLATVDMADNANKMGTSMEMIQNAYQGFAKQNFTMLDNLKLGYGGTKTEMERLLTDAENIKAKQGEVKDYSIDSFADIVEAIHTVQQEYEVSGYSVEELEQKLKDMSLSEQDLRRVSQDLGISYEEAMQRMKDGSLTAQDAIILTGTTSYEASSTIEGSFNRMKASWENWLLSLANPEMDLGETTNQLIDSVILAAENIIPRAIEVIGRLGEAIAKHAPEAIGKLTEAFKKAVPPEFQQSMDAAGESLERLGEKWKPVIEHMKNVGEKVAPKVKEILDALGNTANTFLMPALGRLGEAVSNLTESFEYWAEPIMNVIGLFGQGFIAALGVTIDSIAAAIQIISDIMNALRDFCRWVEDTGRAIGAFANDARRFFGDFGKGVSNTIDKVIGWFRDLPQNLLNALGDLGNLLWNAGCEIVNGLVDGIVNNFWQVGDSILGGLDDAVNQALSFLGIASPSKLFKWIGEMSMEGLEGGLEDNMSLIEDAMGDVEDVMSIKPVTDVSMTSSAVTGAHGGYGNVLNVYVDKMEVRDEYDIYKTAEQLNDIWRREMAGVLA